MKKQISLKLYVSLIFLSLTALLVIGYSILSVRYYRLGMHSIIASGMAQAATEYLESLPPQQRTITSRYHGYILAGKWGDMPGEVRAQLPSGPLIPGELVIVGKSGFLKPPDNITFALLYQDGGESLYIARQSSRQSAPPLVGKNAVENLRNLVSITLVAALLVAVVTWLILRQVSGPVSALGRWARNLDENKLQQPAPDFSYPELNELARLIRTSLKSVQDGLDRERSFLKHASHELRTPISVIRNSIELMQKLQGYSEPDKQARQQLVIDRIDRASLNMKHMTETLLWLSRDEESVLPVRPVQLDRLVNELAEDLSYLTSGKEVKVSVATSPFTMKTSETVAGIVLGNLIRNAFQHTTSGVVRIDQHENHITIVNSNLWPNSTEDDLGFGLGLKLTRQLSDKLDWPYENLHSSTGNTVSLTIMEQADSTML